MSLVIVGAATAGRVEAALAAFEAAGWARAGELVGWDRADGVMGLTGGGAGALREADGRGVKYVLVHSGPPDGDSEGTYERAHHRVEPAQLAELARRLRTRERMLVTVMAFAYKNGIPEGSAWVVDVRFLDNPYWVPELKPLDGRDERVRRHVLDQPPAGRLLEGLEVLLRQVLPDYAMRGRMELTIAFGCTGGRHRSVVMAAEMARRLERLRGVEVRFEARDLP